MADTKQIALRVQPTFYDQLSALAKKESRSLHAMVVFILRSYFDADMLQKRLTDLQSEQRN